MIRILLLLLFIYSPGILHAQHQPVAYTIIDSSTGKSISLDEFISKLKKTDVLVFGEQHDDSIAHLLQLAILKKMTQSYPATALSLEMFSTDTQPVLNEYLSGLISERNFLNESRAWKNYKDYRPLIEQAKAAHTAVIAANAATRYSNAVSSGGLAILESFPEISKSFLPPLPIDTAIGKYHEKFIKTLGGHSMGTMKIFQTQNLWDATMAWSIASYSKSYPGSKILHLNGRFHSDEKLGMVTQLKKYAPQLAIMNISCFPSNHKDAKELKNFAELADFIVLTGQE